MRTLIIIDFLYPFYFFIGLSIPKNGLDLLFADARGREYKVKSSKYKSVYSSNTTQHRLLRYEFYYTDIQLNNIYFKIIHTKYFNNSINT